MSTRGRTLAVGGVLLAVLVGGLARGIPRPRERRPVVWDRPDDSTRHAECDADRPARPGRAGIPARVGRVGRRAAAALDTSRLREAFTGRALQGRDQPGGGTEAEERAGADPVRSTTTRSR